jgi:hypothetical protein
LIIKHISEVFDMSGQEEKKESFEDFKNSFTYGKRSDLNFKFLSNLSDKKAAEFIQILLWKLGDAMNDGDWNQIVNHIIEGQIKAYSRTVKVNYPDGLFIAMPKDIARAKLALITSSGNFVDGDDPQPLGIPNMTQEEAEKRIMDFMKEEPVLSIIPKTTPIKKLRVRHGGYDTRGALADPSVNFPLEQLKVLEQKGVIGELASDAYSFVGACSQIRLLKSAGPRWVSLLQEKAVDVALLVPV